MISLDIDVAVIGIGLTGLAAAIKVKEAGLSKVVIIERGEIGKWYMFLVR